MRKKPLRIERQLEIADWAMDSSLLHLTNHEYKERIRQEADPFFVGCFQVFPNDLVNHAWSGLIDFEDTSRLSASARGKKLERFA